MERQHPHNAVLFSLRPKAVTAASSAQLRGSHAAVVYCLENSDTYPRMRYMQSEQEGKQYDCDLYMPGTREQWTVYQASERTVTAAGGRKTWSSGDISSEIKPPTQSTSQHASWQQSGKESRLNKVQEQLGTSSATGSHTAPVWSCVWFSQLKRVSFVRPIKVSMCGLQANQALMETKKKNTITLTESWLLRLAAFTVSAYYLLISAVTEAARRLPAL